MHNWIAHFVRTRRGGVALTTGILATVLAGAVSGTMSLLLLPVWLALGWGIAYVWERQSEASHPPEPAPFTRRQSSSSLRTMLRQDRNAHFLTDSNGFLWRRRIWFEGTGCPPTRVPGDTFARMEIAHRDDPVLVAIAADRRYWWWEDSFYWENEGYEALDVKALILRTRRQKDRQLQHAHALMAGEKSRRRDPIPEDVKRFVWQRDGGQCQECGSSELLQYDHVIPWSLGGADTADNLRLLCAECNRLKSDAI